MFQAYSRRLIDLLRVVHVVAFGRMDLRLAQKLLALAQGNSHLRATHQALASKLGTAREVVSRILNDFQKRGLIQQSRRLITLLDIRELRRLAEIA